MEALPNDFILDRLLGDLTKIEDLNVISGLTLVQGEKKRYFKVLMRFCSSADKHIKALTHDTQNHRWRDYATRLRVLKTVFARIGNPFMSDWAARLETAARQEQTDECLSVTPTFCASLKSFQQDLLQLELMKQKSSASLMLVEKLDHLRSACLDSCPESAVFAADDLLGITINSAVDDILTQLRGIVHACDYDRAVEIIDRLMELLD